MIKHVHYDGPLSDPMRCPYLRVKNMGIMWDFATRFECGITHKECRWSMAGIGYTFPANCPLPEGKPEPVSKDDLRRAEANASVFKMLGFKTDIADKEIERMWEEAGGKE